ncbi:hypothetical protein HYS47_00130 [Candidatus Woesearchaeota archaeon]|nr:hypothetical protein [Candidatus Woesearchaeota archaeon]
MFENAKSDGKIGTYTFSTPICRIVIRFQFLSANDFFGEIDESAFSGIIAKALEYAGYQEKQELEIVVYINLLEMRRIRQAVSSAIQKKQPVSIHHHYVTHDLAHVDRADLRTGKNKVYIDFTNGYCFYLLTAYNDTFQHYGVEAISKADEKQLLAGLERHAKEQYLQKLYAVIAHELTHLWHLKKSKASEYCQRRTKRFNRLQKDYEKSIEVEGQIQSLFRYPKESFLSILENILKHLQKWYVHLRKKFILFEQMLCEEGMAVFMEKYLTGKYDFQAIKRNAVASAQKLQQEFNAFLEAFEFIVQFLKKMYQAIQKNSSYYPPKQEIQQYEGMVNIIITFIYSSMGHAPYTIGSDIPSMLYYGSFPIEEFGGFTQGKLIGQYMIACRNFSMAATVSVGDKGSGIFNIYQNTTMFNKLRKELGIS